LATESGKSFGQWAVEVYMCTSSRCHIIYKTITHTPRRRDASVEHSTWML